MIAGMDLEAPSKAGSRPPQGGNERPAGGNAHALRVSHGLLFLLALALPFEMPLFRVGPLQITTVELVLYATLASWAIVAVLDAAQNRGGLRAAVDAVRREPMAQAAIVWGVVLFSSAAVAPSYRAAALKFALRSLSGILVFFAARSLSRPSEVARSVLIALIAGALVSAATAEADALLPAGRWIWRRYREGEFSTLGLARASGVFVYPTIGAMYWEAVVPLLVVAPLLGNFARRDAARATPRVTALALLAAALLVGAIFASATRSGIAGAAVACALLLGLTWRLGAGVRRIAVAVLGLVVASWALTVVSTRPGSLLGQRLQWWHDEEWLRVEYLVDTAPRTAHAGAWFNVPVTLRNTGTVKWERDGARPTHLAYHWQPLDAPMTLEEYEGARTELPMDVPSGGVLEVVAKVRGPAAVGAYRLKWDVVQEGVAWFSDRGNVMPEQPVEVLPSDGLSTVVPSSELPPKVAPDSPPRSALWRAAVALWRERPLLGIGPDNFRRRYEAVLSPTPDGQNYTDTRIHANSLYFETLADLGLAGVAALAFLAFALVRLVRAHYATGSLLGLGASAAVAAFFVHGAFDYFLEFTPLLGLFWLLLGLTAAAEQGHSSSGGRQDTPA
jgi:hypothetical protein